MRDYEANGRLAKEQRTDSELGFWGGIARAAEIPRDEGRQLMKDGVWVVPENERPVGWEALTRRGERQGESNVRRNACWKKCRVL